MPIYEYVCLNCKNEFETIRPMSLADVPLPCIKCGAKDVRRKLSMFFAESGGRSVAGMSEPSCGECTGGHCSSCGH